MIVDPPSGMPGGGSSSIQRRGCLFRWLDWTGAERRARVISCAAGWSSSVARWAHNPEVVGSNPAPATRTMKAPVE
ncbi:hypothetical protein FRIGORI9N_370063 [Frigoribacterium sp. 9N]|nr:hypothetical protein FRIGORI9N_370063 [Frigoribacterium sp. 9N]